MYNSVTSAANQSYFHINIAANNSKSSNFDITSNPKIEDQQTDNVTLSPESASIKAQTAENQPEKKITANSAADSVEITFEELKKIQDLQLRDAEVKAHEQAHLSAAGQYAAGGASFTYTTGPNGKRYATGGEVPIDLSKEKDPQATLLKMTQVRRAALAPASPSAADRNIAARAAMIAAEASREINNTPDEKSNSEKSSRISHDDEALANKQSSGSSIENRSLQNLDDAAPSHTRHMVLKAYAAQS
jgi:hypothetical protein